jgi:NAD(P)-dependent dehydrogenase (short-subunit alcohol dehydrogenase family)
MTGAEATAYDCCSMTNGPNETRGTALITGGGRRIGAAITRALAQVGYTVVMHAYRSHAEAEQLAAEITRSGGKAHVVRADLADAESVRGLVPAAAAFGPLTLLVNSAAEFEPDEIATLTPEGFARTLAVNLTAPLFLTQAFAAQARQGSSIINVLDQRVFKPTPRFLSYTLSKSALHTATTTLAQALAPKLRVNAVAPGPTLPSPRQSEAQFRRQTGNVPLGRGAGLDEFGAALRFLLAARSFTGQMLALDGGQHLNWAFPGSGTASEE